jgi:glycosyltransferase involved in cell wall biosynthesis
MADNQQDWVLQLCHGYDGPFLDCARQYAALFKGTPYKVCTVYLTGEENEEVRIGSESDKVIFLGYRSRQLRGLKLSAIRSVRKLLKDFPDAKLVIAHRFKPLYVSLLSSSLPVIGVHHAFGDYQRRTRRLFVQRFKDRLMLLGVSNAVRDQIRDFLPNWPKKQIETLYNRIDISKVQESQYSRELSRKHLSLPSQAWIIGNVGRLHPDKDQATLIRGFARALPLMSSNSFLVIMGTGKLENDLKNLASKLNISEKVIFLGQVPEGRRYFKAFDLFVLTSDHEPFGMVLLEALAAGLPIICSDCGGGKEVVEGYGTLFPLGDSNALAKQIVSYNANLNEKPIAEIRQHLNYFSDEAVKSNFWSLGKISDLIQKESANA